MSLIVLILKEEQQSPILGVLSYVVGYFDCYPYSSVSWSSGDAVLML